MTAARGPRGPYAKPALVEKTCTACKKTLPVADFYPGRETSTGRVVLRATCRPCSNAARTQALIRERTRLNELEASGAGTRARISEAVPVAFRSSPAVPSAVVASLNQMKNVDVIVGDGAIVVRQKREAEERRAAFRAERGDYPFLPAYGTADGCPKGLHAFPIEVPCRGYQALDCLGLGPHIHRKCPTHSVEVIERAPLKDALVPVMVRRRA